MKPCTFELCTYYWKGDEPNCVLKGYGLENCAYYQNQQKAVEELSSIYKELDHGWNSPCVAGNVISNGIMRLKKLIELVENNG